LLQNAAEGSYLYLYMCYMQGLKYHQILVCMDVTGVALDNQNDTNVADRPR